MHVAFVAPSRAAVDAFYAAAIKAGGKDNGAPGLGRNTTPIITGPSSSIPTATMPRPSAICLRKSRNQRAQFGSEKVQGSGGVTATFSPVLGSFFVHRG